MIKISNSFAKSFLMKASNFSTNRLIMSSHSCGNSLINELSSFLRETLIDKELSFLRETPDKNRSFLREALDKDLSFFRETPDKPSRLLSCANALEEDAYKYVTYITFRRRLRRVRGRAKKAKISFSRAPSMPPLSWEGIRGARRTLRTG